jgi:hypothetical protein
MKTKDNSNSKQAMLIVVLVGLVFIALTYFLVYQKFNEKTAKLKADNLALVQHVNELKVYYDNRETYEEQKTYYASRIKDELKDFPADVRDEDKVMLAVKTLAGADIDYTNINPTEAEAYYTIENSVDPALLVAVGLDNLEGQLIFAKRTAAYINKTDYKGLKNIVKVMNAYGYESALNNITYSKNQKDNVLEGTVEVTFYNVYGDGKKYTPVDMHEYTKGLEDLFNLKKKVPKTDTSGETGEEGTEEADA